MTITVETLVLDHPKGNYTRWKGWLCLKKNPNPDLGSPTRRLHQTERAGGIAKMYGWGKGGSPDLCSAHT